MSEEQINEELEEFIQDYHAERRINDEDNEVIIFERGYTRSTPGGWPADKVWFCRVTKRGLTVEDYATKKRAALRTTRRAWEKARAERWREQYGYPRVINGED